MPGCIPFGKNRWIFIQAPSRSRTAKTVALEGEKFTACDIDFPLDILFRLFCEIAVKIALIGVSWRMLLNNFILQGHPHFLELPGSRPGAAETWKATVPAGPMVPGRPFWGQRR